MGFGWLVGCVEFNGHWRQYFILYRAVSQREGDRGGQRRERIDESKNVQTTPTRTYCKRSRPLPYCNQNCRTPRHCKFTQHHRTTRPPPAMWATIKEASLLAHLITKRQMKPQRKYRIATASNYYWEVETSFTVCQPSPSSSAKVYTIWLAVWPPRSSMYRHGQQLKSKKRLWWSKENSTVITRWDTWGSLGRQQHHWNTGAQEYYQMDPDGPRNRQVSRPNQRNS